MQAVPDNHSPSPQEKATLKEKAERGPISAAFFFLIVAALAPAFVHVLYVVGRWSWQLIG